MLKVFANCGRIVGAGVLCATLILAGESSIRAQQSDQSLMSQLVVYLNVPKDVDGGMQLTLAGIDLVGDHDTLPLTFLQGKLFADDLRGRQTRLIDEFIEPGRYRGLRVRLSGVTGHVGPAPVSPRVRVGGYIVETEFGAESNRTHCLFLEWPARMLRPEDTLYQLNWRRAAQSSPPFGSLIFVTNEASHNMTVVDRADYRVIDVVRTGQGPRGLTYSVINRQLYVANATSNEISVLDALSRQLIRTVELSFGDEPTRLALSPDERYLYVLNTGSRTLVIIDSRSFTLVARHQVGFGPTSLTVDPRSGYVYIADEESDRLVVYDPIALRELPAVFSTGGAPSEVLINDRGTELFLAGGERRQLNVYDLATSAQTQTIKLCSPPVGLAYDPVTRRLFASLARCKEVAILQPENGVELHSVPLGSEPGLIHLDSEHRYLLVVLPEEASLGVLNVTRRKLQMVVPVGDRPYEAIAPR